MEQINITLTGQGIQDTSTLSIHIAIEATIEVDAKTAQRNVTRWLVSEVGNMLIGHTPHLVMNPQPIWRIPVMLTSSTVGLVGEAGFVDVDAHSGQLLLPDTLSEEIRDRVKHLTA